MEKPKLHLLKGQGITAAQLGELFKKLTGRDPTPAEMEQAEKDLAAAKKARLTTTKEPS